MPGAPPGAPPSGSTAPLILAFVAVQMGIMQGSGSFPALLPTFSEIWQISETDAGLINGIYYAGYFTVVPFLVSLSDRLPARRIFICSASLGIIASFGFAFLADGFWTAMLFRALGGISIAGTYMPGLKLLTDHLEHRFPNKDHSRGVAFYVSGFGLGLSLSFFLSGVINEVWGWQWAFAVSALGPISAIGILTIAVPGPDPKPAFVPTTHVFDLRPVLRRGQVMGYVMAYTVHNFEIFAFRSFGVAYLVFAMSAGPDPAGAAAFPITAPTIMAAAILLGPVGSVLGNELSIRIGRQTAIAWLMFASAALAAAFGFLADLPYLIVLPIFMFYCVLQVSDSASITAGAVAAAAPGYRGATMAVHSCIGFMGSFAGPVVFGMILDFAAPAADGGPSLQSWGWAFIGVAVVVATGPLFVRWLGGPAPRD